VAIAGDMRALIDDDDLMAGFRQNPRNDGAAEARAYDTKSHDGFAFVRP
jgi:hypothetical protein